MHGCSWCILLTQDAGKKHSLSMPELWAMVVQSMPIWKDDSESGGSGPDGDGLLNFLRREATKHNGSDKHRAIINLMEDILCSPGLQRQAHAQITVRVQRWEMDFVRMALSFPLLTHLDLTGAVLVIAPGEGRSSSLRCDPSAAGFAHSHGTHSAPTCFGLSPLGLEEAVEPSAFPSRPSWASPLASAGVLGASGYPSRPVGASPLSRVGIAAELWGDQLAGPEASRVLQWLSLDERPASILSASTQRLAALAAQNMMDGASGTSLNATFPPRRSPSSEHSQALDPSPGRLGMAWPPGGPDGCSTWPPTAADPQGASSSSSSHQTSTTPAAASDAAEAGPSGSKRKAAWPIMQSQPSGSGSLHVGGSRSQPPGLEGWASQEGGLKRQVKGAAAGPSGCVSQASGSNPLLSGRGPRTGRLPAATGLVGGSRPCRPDSPCRTHRGWYSANVVTDVLPLEASLLADVVQALPRLQCLSLQFARVSMLPDTFCS